MEILRKILGLPLEDENRAKYNANAIGKRISVVKIDGIEIKGYSAFSFVRKLSYIKSPVRSGDGTIGNLDSYATFTTPQLQIDFSLLFIDSYRDIMNLIYEKREHLVECYDIVRDTRVQEKMYFEPEELPKIWSIAREIQGQSDNVIELLGVQDYSVVMVGTNIPAETINVIYYDRNNNIIGSQQGAENTEFLVGSGISVPDIDGYSFNNAWERVGIREYLNNEAYRLVLQTAEEKEQRAIIFKAVYKDSQQYTLAFSYGLGEPYKDINGSNINSIHFVVNDTIGEALSRENISLWEGGVLSSLPVSADPTIKINKKAYTTHNRIGWFETSTRGIDENGNPKPPLTNDSVLSVNANMIIYQLFSPVKHSVTFESNGGTQYSNLQNVEYGATIPLPMPYREGYIFGGWYSSSDFADGTLYSASNTMPPYPLILYAKWELNEQ